MSQITPQNSRDDLVPTVKEKLDQFGKITEVNAWLDGIGSRPTTRPIT